MEEEEDGASSPQQGTPKKKLLQRNALGKNDKPKHRRTKFNQRWKSMDLFKNWLVEDRQDCYKCICTACNRTSLQAEITTLRRHAKTQTHISNCKSIKGVQSCVKLLEKSHDSGKNAVKSAEIRLASFFAEHDISFRTVDHLPELMKNCFPDSEIAKGVVLKRTKCAAI